MPKQQFIYAWLRLAQSKNIGCRTFATLIKMFQSPAVALEQLPELARRGGSKKAIRIATIKEVDALLAGVGAFGAQIIFPFDNLYPYLLKQIPDWPPFLVAKGRVELLAGRKVAIVGARNSSTNGNIIAANLADELSRAGLVVVSGLARGIDASAHQAVLKHQRGTIGVVAGGIDFIYPRENEKIYRAMYEEGLVVSEKAMGAQPTADSFPQRNRLISGMSLGVVVVEANKKSGTLITAHCAAEQGREVFAVPGSPLDPRHHGTNHLIQEGAVLVQTADDVLQNIQCLFDRHNSSYIEDSSRQGRYLAADGKDAGGGSGTGEMQGELKQPVNGGGVVDTDTDVAKNLQKLVDDDFQASGYSAKMMSNEDEMREVRREVLVRLSYTPVNLQSIISESDLPEHLVNIAVIEMEIAGKVERSYGNMVSLVYDEE